MTARTGDVIASAAPPQTPLDVAKRVTNVRETNAAALHKTASARAMNAVVISTSATNGAAFKQKVVETSCSALFDINQYRAKGPAIHLRWALLCTLKG